MLLSSFASHGKGTFGGGVDDGAEVEREGDAASPTPSLLAKCGSSDDDAIVAMDEDDVPCVGPHTPNA